MSDYIMLPRSALPQVWRDKSLSELLLYLLSKVDRDGVAQITSGEIGQVLGLSRQRLRTLIGRLKEMGIITNYQPTANQLATKCTFNTQRVTTNYQPTTNQLPTRSQPSEPRKKQNKRSLTSVEVSLSFVAPEFAHIWQRYMQYRKEIKKPYKSEASERTAYNKMVEMAGGDPDKARDMVERAILGQWQGLYAGNGKQPAPVGKPVVDLDKAEEGAAQRNELYSREYLHGDALAEKLKGFKLSAPDPVLPDHVRNINP